MANVQVLKETENSVFLKVVGTSAETATIFDASTYAGATGPINQVNIEAISWSCQDTGMLTLEFVDGATGITIGKFARNGDWELKRKHNVKIIPGSTGANGDIKITSTSGNYTLLLDLEKTGDGWTKQSS